MAIVAEDAAPAPAKTRKSNAIQFPYYVRQHLNRLSRSADEDRASTRGKEAEMGTKRRESFKLGGLLGLRGLVRQAHGDTTDATVAGSWMVQIVYDSTTNNLGSNCTHKTAMCQFFDDGRWIGSVSAVKPGSSESCPASVASGSFVH